MSRVLALLAAMVAAVVAGCGGSAAPQRHLDEPGAIINAETVSQAVPADAASVQRVTYQSRSGVDDSSTHVTGSVYVPRGTAPQGGFHVVGYGPAVSPTSSDCGSQEASARSSAVINALLNAGYVVAVPDYQGLGDPSDGKRLYHPALDSTTAGYNLMDAVRAAKNLVDNTSPIWAAVGEAQGGQAAWAVNELADNYGFQSLRGTVSISPIADVSGLADAAAEGTLTPEQQRVYISYLAALATEYTSEFHLDDYRHGAAKGNWDLLLGCRPADDEARAAAFAQITPDDLRPATPQALAVLQTYLQKTTLPQGPAQQPMLVIYGDQDPLTPAAWTERAIARACGMRDQITVRQQPSPALDTEALDWIASRLREEPVPNDCEAFVAAHPLPSHAPAPTAQPAIAEPVPALPATDARAGEHAAETSEVSLIDGWMPVTIQVITGLALVAATGWRSRRWRLRWLPVAAAVGVTFIGAAWWFFDSQGWGSVYPWGMWVWIGLTGLAATVLVLGWPGSPWWRRTLSVLAVPLCVLSAGTVLNASLGYLPTVATAWQRVTGQLPPQWIDQTRLAELQRDGIRPTRGTVVRITTPSDISGFAHRAELVYLPPVWFTSNPPPPLPVVMMLGAELSSPPDWLQSGRALGILDNFGLQHRGTTPVMAFPDTSGSFTNDTECVNGPRGNAADHLIKEFVPHVVSDFNTQPSNWGLVGWSSGGTCSLTLAVSHPEIFSAIVDLDGQLGPNAGKKQQTIARLFGGDADAWAAFDPKTIVEAHRYYYDLAAWIGVSARDSRPGTGPRVPVQRSRSRCRTGTTTRRTTPRPPLSCANCSARTEPNAQLWDTAVATTSLRRQTVSRMRCHGSPAGSAPPVSRMYPFGGLAAAALGLGALIQADRGGGGHIEALGATGHRDGDPVVGQRGHLRRQAVGLGPEQPRGRRGDRLGVVEVDLAVHCGGQDLQAGRRAARHSARRHRIRPPPAGRRCCPPRRAGTCRCRGRHCGRRGSPRRRPSRRPTGSACPRCRARRVSTATATSRGSVGQHIGQVGVAAAAHRDQSDRSHGVRQRLCGALGDELHRQRRSAGRRSAARRPRWRRPRSTSPRRNAASTRLGPSARKRPARRRPTWRCSLTAAATRADRSVSVSGSLAGRGVHILRAVRPWRPRPVR